MKLRSGILMIALSTFVCSAAAEPFRAGYYTGKGDVVFRLIAEAKLLEGVKASFDGDVELVPFESYEAGQKGFDEGKVDGMLMLLGDAIRMGASEPKEVILFSIGELPAADAAALRAGMADSYRPSQPMHLVYVTRPEAATDRENIQALFGAALDTIYVADRDMAYPSVPEMKEGMKAGWLNKGISGAVVISNMKPDAVVPPIAAELQAAGAIPDAAAILPIRMSFQPAAPTASPQQLVTDSEGTITYSTRLGSRGKKPEGADAATTVFESRLDAEVRMPWGTTMEKRDLDTLKTGGSAPGASSPSGSAPKSSNNGVFKLAPEKK